MTQTQSPILVPLDGSDNAMHVLPMAALLSRYYDAPLRVIHVFEAEGEVETSEMARVTTTFEEHVAELAERYDLSEHTVTANVIASDSPADAILTASRDACAIALASHGRGGFRAMFIGSVADKVIRGSRVPTFVVPGDGVPPSVPRAVLVALDGSPESERALEPARGIAGVVGARVTVMRSYHLPPPGGDEFTYNPAVVIEALTEEVAGYLDGVVRPGEKTLAMQGPPADAILEAAEQLDAGLVVMTSSGKGLGARLALGSTTDRVMHSLRRPLMIIPPRAAQA